MKITVISDTHGQHHKIREILPCDILIFAGDCMSCGYKEQELYSFLDWFQLQPSTHKIMVAGNHDRYIQNHPKGFKETMRLYPNITYLEDSGIEINGCNIWGTPWSKIFYNWAFNAPEEKLKEKFEMIPRDTNILVSHAPQYDVMDTLVSGLPVGEITLTKQIEKLKNLDLHCVGHIHNCFGIIKPHKKHITINASQVDEDYYVTNFPLTVELYKQ